MRTSFVAFSLFCSILLRFSLHPSDRRCSGLRHSRSKLQLEPAGTKSRSNKSRIKDGQCCTMAMATSTSNICPFTFKTIGAIQPEDLAVVYESNPLLADNAEPTGTLNIQCGHSCNLSNLVSYLHDTGGTKLCPVCQSSSASFICDSTSSISIARRTNAQHNTHGSVDSDGDGGGGRIVSFRYGTIVYFLWVKSPQQLSSSYTSIFRDRNGGNALDRIAHVLGMDVKSGLKVIHKGKIIYPHAGNNATASRNDSTDEASEQILDISVGDIIHRRKKPSLVVMGLRLQSTSPGMRTNTLSDVIFTALTMITPWYLWNKMLCGFRWTFSSASSLLGGIFIFFRSILYPPQASRQ